MTVTENFISDTAGVLGLPGDMNPLFVLITKLPFHAYQKNFATIVFTFRGGLSIIDIFFCEKKRSFSVFFEVGKKELLEVLKLVSAIFITF